MSFLRSVTDTLKLAENFLDTIDKQADATITGRPVTATSGKPINSAGRDTQAFTAASDNNSSSDVTSVHGAEAYAPSYKSRGELIAQLAQAADGTSLSTEVPASAPSVAPAQSAPATNPSSRRQSQSLSASDVHAGHTTDLTTTATASDATNATTVIDTGADTLSAAASSSHVSQPVIDPILYRQALTQLRELDAINVQAGT
jgi:hypothetical protein